MVAIIGNGNVAHHLFRAFKEKTETVMVNSRTLENLPENPDLILICVKDDAIAEVADKLGTTKAVVAHTAGSVPMEVLSHTSSNYGVFYPLQTFTKDVELNYCEIPIFIEANSLESESILIKTASLISEDIRKADSEARKTLHLASVFSCNFVNALAGIASDILGKSGIEFSALMPLMTQTVNKLKNTKPSEAQTGPAKRGDREVIASHLQMLEDLPQYKEIYSKLSNLINPKLKENEI